MRLVARGVLGGGGRAESSVVSAHPSSCSNSRLRAHTLTGAHLLLLWHLQTLVCARLRTRVCEHGLVCAPPTSITNTLGRMCASNASVGGSVAGCPDGGGVEPLPPWGPSSGTGKSLDEHGGLSGKSLTPGLSAIYFKVTLK